MRNWVRTASWSTPSQNPFTASSTYIDFATWWRHGPGSGGVSNGYLLEASPGEWEGNPDRFLSIVWTATPSAGEGHYVPTFRFTFLEHFGIKTARALAGKQVTLSWQLRSSGCLISPVIYRGGLNIPVASRTPFPDLSMQLWSGPQFNIGPTIQRCDFTMMLPAMPPGTTILPDSYLGIGLDLIGQSGPTIDIGPMQLNEGGPQPIEEVPIWQFT